MECDWEGHYLVPHLISEHGMDSEGYLEKHPGSQLLSYKLRERWKEKCKGLRRKEPSSREELTVEICDFQCPVNWDVPASDCLLLPDHYKFPEYGDLADDVQESLVSLLRGRVVYLWGMPGSGKDAFVHAYAHKTRTPSRAFQVNPGEDIESWFFTRSFNTEGTFWEEGDLLKCLRDGYRTRSGRRIPYLILVSDVDRATKTQMESLRMVFDSIQGRVKGPAGRMYPLFPGTQLVMTANTSGAGDSRGRSISANPIDASIMDRFDRAFEFHWMEWDDELEIVKNKFPFLWEKSPDSFEHVGQSTAKLRTAIHQGQLYAEFSHRSVCAWLGHAEDILHVTPGGVPNDLLKRSARCWLDKMPDAATRTSASKLIDSHVPGGTLGPSAGQGGGMELINTTT
jgi:hypothetical protein